MRRSRPPRAPRRCRGRRRRAIRRQRAAECRARRDRASAAGRRPGGAAGGPREGGELAELSPRQRRSLRLVPRPALALSEYTGARTSCPARRCRRAAHNAHARAPPRRRRPSRGRRRAAPPRSPTSPAPQRQHARRSARRHEQAVGRAHAHLRQRRRQRRRPVPPAVRTRRALAQRALSPQLARHSVPASPASPTSTQAPSSRAVAERRSRPAEAPIRPTIAFSSRRRLLKLWQVREQHVDGGGSARWLSIAAGRPATAIHTSPHDSHLSPRNCGDGTTSPLCSSNPRLHRLDAPRHLRDDSQSTAKTTSSPSPRHPPRAARRKRTSGTSAEPTARRQPRRRLAARCEAGGAARDRPHARCRTSRRGG